MWVYQEKTGIQDETAFAGGARLRQDGPPQPRFSDETEPLPGSPPVPAQRSARPAPVQRRQKAAASADRPVPAPAPQATSVPAEPRREADKTGVRPGAPSAAAPRRKSGQATRDCLLLAAAYLFGTALSGVMQSLCEARELDMLSYYLKSWGALFTVQDAKSAAALFGAQYFSAMGAVTVLLLFGLCAFGPVLIFLFTMLYGVGTGIVSLQIFLQNTLARYGAYLLFWGVPAAAMACCLCFFGATALQVSVRLQNTAFGRRRSVPIASSARLLLGQYCLIGILLLPVCGIAAALLYALAGL